MKKLFTLIVLLAINSALFSQAPQRLSYQAVIRNSTGGLVTNHAVGMKISILQGSSSGTAVYVETHTPATNANGLATIEIGGGNLVSGSFATINWPSSTYYLKTETDPSGGTSYTIVGTSQLLSVPYALNSKTSDGVADNSITSAKISDGAVATSDLGNNSVTSVKITDGTIVAADLASNSVTTEKISSGAVTGAKIAQGGATNGQTLKWNNTASTWGPADDITGGAITLPYSGSLSIGGAGAAVFEVTNTGLSSTGYGIKGSTLSNDGAGIGGTATNTEGSGCGVYGASYSENGIGVHGIAFKSTGSAHGVLGESESATGFGVKGRAYNASGTNYGVYGLSKSVSGYGVYGKASSATGTNYGVYGESSSPDGYAGYFKGRLWETGSTTGNTDLFYVTNTGTGRAIHAVAAGNTAVWGESTSGYAGVDGRNNSGIGVSGHSATYYGVYGKSNDSYGVFGTSGLTGGRFEGVSTGVYAISTGTEGINYGVYGKTNSASGYAGYFEGSVKVTGNLSKGGGSFEIDHPLDPANKILRHSFVESPDMMNVYNGNIRTDANGIAVVILPDYFEALNSDFRYQLTVIGEFAQAIISAEISDNRFTISTDKPNVKVSWQVTGVRKDPWAAENRIVVEENKRPEFQGQYLYPEVYGKDKNHSSAEFANPGTEK